MSTAVGLGIEELTLQALDGMKRYTLSNKGRIEAALENGACFIKAKAWFGPRGGYEAWLNQVGCKKRTAHKWVTIVEAGFISADSALINNGLDATYNAIRLAVQRAKQEDSAANPPPVPTGTYSLVLADPPWQYDFAESSTREIENQYPTLPVDQICALPLQDLFADDCLLFLWATSPKLREAFQVMAAWDFEYVTNAVWVKDKFGMGYYFRQQHELLLVGRKGNPPLSLPETRVSSVFEAPRTGHSEKPEDVHLALEAMYPKLPKLELFARSKREGWEVWGNESA